MNEPIYVTITGTAHYYGTDFIKIGYPLHLIKEPDNPYDQEAIRAELPLIGKIGYVANSPYTVPRGCRSAGRVFDSFEQRIYGIVKFVVKDTIIVELTEQAPDLIPPPPFMYSEPKKTGKRYIF